jgi:hypothetical protein
LCNKLSATREYFFENKVPLAQHFVAVMKPNVWRSSLPSSYDGAMTVRAGDVDVRLLRKNILLRAKRIQP